MISMKKLVILEMLVDNFTECSLSLFKIKNLFARTLFNTKSKLLFQFAHLKVRS